MRAGRWCAGIVGVALGLGACSTSHDNLTASSATTDRDPDSATTTLVDSVPVVTAASIDDTDTGWVHVESQAVIYIAFAEDVTGKITGNLSISRTSDSGTTVEPGSYTMTGAINGGTIAITFANRTWTGTITGSTITLNLQQDDGTIEQARWERGSIDDYNAAVAVLQTGANVAVATSIANADAAATASSLEAAATREANRIDKIYRNVLYDISSLDAAVKALPGALAAVDAAVASVRTAANDPTLTSGDCGDSDYQLSNVSYEVSNVEYAISGVDYVTQPIPKAIADLQQQIDALTPVAQTDAQVDALDAAPSAITDAYAALSAANKADTESKSTADAIYAQAAQAEAAHCPAGASNPIATAPAETIPDYTIPDITDAPDSTED